jgi:hypothetical protein
MKRKFIWRFLFGVLAFVLFSLFLSKVIVEPWIGQKIQTVINEHNNEYLLEIGKVHLSIWSSELELENIILKTKPELKGIVDLHGEVGTIRFGGIQLWKAIFKKDIDIHTVTIFNSNIKGSIPFPEKARPPQISTLNIKIDSLFFDRTNLKIRNTANSEAISLKDGVLKLYDLQVDKLDTISAAMIQHFDFDALEFFTVSPDSMYTYTATGINYSADLKTMAADSFSVKPNYSDNEFTARHKFQTNCFRAGFKNISVHNFLAEDFLKTRMLVSSYIEIGKMNLYVFRDKRKPFKHNIKPIFQEMISSYPGFLRIDSIGFITGNIVYREYSEKANEPGHIRFSEVNAKIYNLTNDTIFKTKEAFLKLNAQALLMGVGKLSVLLKSKIFDPQNTFSMNGTLSGMELKCLNPILEKSAFLHINSGKIDAMNFSFKADNTKALGNLTMLYHGLDIAIINKQTNGTTAIKEQLMSIIGNMILVNSNPSPGEAVRTGTIDQERNPEKFLIGYSFRSILSGIKTSIIKSPNKVKQ